MAVHEVESLLQFCWTNWLDESAVVESCRLYTVQR